jgi:hypothetical protein
MICCPACIAQLGQRCGCERPNECSSNQCIKPSVLAWGHHLRAAQQKSLSRCGVSAAAAQSCMSWPLMHTSRACWNMNMALSTQTSTVRGRCPHGLPIKKTTCLIGRQQRRGRHASSSPATCSPRSYSLLCRQLAARVNAPKAPQRGLRRHPAGQLRGEQGPTSIPPHIDTQRHAVQCTPTWHEGRCSHTAAAQVWSWHVPKCPCTLPAAVGPAGPGRQRGAPDVVRGGGAGARAVGHAGSRRHPGAGGVPHWAVLARERRCWHGL